MATLKTLRIRNLVIIEDLTVEFGAGLNLLTGETGAGKSILVDALGFVAGARADRTLVRAGAERAGVEALFGIERSAGAAGWLVERGFGEEHDEELTIRREVAAAGASRILINGSPATLHMLRELAPHLLELHGQHDPKRLLESRRHLELLDAHGGHGLQLECVRAAYRAVRETRERLVRLAALDEEREQRRERLAGLVREVEQLAPVGGELDRLEGERRVLQNAGRVAELLERAISASYEGEPSAAGLAAGAASQAQELGRLDPSLEELAVRLRAAAVEIEDAASGLVAYRERTDFDPARLEAIEGRRAALERACLAHGVDEAGLLERAEEAREALRALDSLDDERRELSQLAEGREAEYAAASRALSRSRGRAGKRMATAVDDELAALALERANFRVELTPGRGPTVGAEGEPSCVLGPRGSEGVEFLLAANPGEPLRPLRQVASGGELSRVMLALHVVAEREAATRVLVFDEIDAGVGGPVGDAVGARLCRLARRRQVLCVTHLPQVAAYADRHFRVGKRVAAGRTRAGISDLTGNDRVEELARMLGGRRPTTTSRRHATELLRAAGRAARAEA